MALSVQDRIDQQADYARRQGDNLNQQAQDRAWSARQSRGAYQDAANEAYSPLYNNQGGYNAEEAARIYGDPSQYTTSDEDLAGNFLTGQEQQDIRGNPWARAAYFDSDSDMARALESSGRQRNAVSDLRQGLDSSISPDLALDTAYRDKQEGTIAGSAARQRAAVDPALLRADKGALDSIRMSPEEEARMVTAAGNTVGNSSRAAADDVLRRSRAAGMNPLGAAAARERLENASAVNKGDAMTNARVAASNARATRAGTAEDYRMRGEESAADRVGAAERGAGQFEVSGRAGLEDQRLGATRDISNRRLQAATTAGNAAVGTEGDIAARETASRNFNTTTGTALATGIEQDEQARNERLANNRQTVNAGNQDTRFRQGQAVAQQNSTNARAVGDARRQDAAEGRGYLQGQIAGNRADEQADYNRQAQIYGTQGQQNAAATQAQVQQNGQPRWWERALGAVGGVANAAANIYTGGG